MMKAMMMSVTAVQAINMHTGPGVTANMPSGVPGPVDQKAAAMAAAEKLEATAPAAPKADTTTKSEENGVQAKKGMQRPNPLQQVLNQVMAQVQTMALLTNLAQQAVDGNEEAKQAIEKLPEGAKKHVEQTMEQIKKMIELKKLAEGAFANQEDAKQAIEKLSEQEKMIVDGMMQQMKFVQQIKKLAELEQLAEDVVAEKEGAEDKMGKLSEDDNKIVQDLVNKIKEAKEIAAQIEAQFQKMQELGQLAEEVVAEKEGAQKKFDELSEEDKMVVEDFVGEIKEAQGFEQMFADFEDASGEDDQEEVADAQEDDVAQEQ